MQLADALIRQNAPSSTAMAIIPMGTANDFATGAGIPEDPWEALQLAVHDTAHPVDVGLVNDQASLPCQPCLHQALWPSHPTIV